MKKGRVLAGVRDSGLSQSPGPQGRAGRTPRRRHQGGDPVLQEMMPVRQLGGMSGGYVYSTPMPAQVRRRQRHMEDL